MRVLTKEFTVVLPSGKPVTAEFEATWVHESNYGADADGNRGSPIDYIDELYLTVSPDDPSWDIDDNGEQLTEEEKEEAQYLLFQKAENDDWDERFDENNAYD